jgi:hypothetical protein
VPKCPPARSRPGFRTRLGMALRTLRCLCKRHGFRGVAGNSSCTAAKSPSWPSVTMRSICVAPRRRLVLEDTHPALFIFLGTGAPRQYFFISGQIYSQSRQDHGRIGLIPMAHAEVDAIQREDTEVGLQRAFAPGSKLLLQITIEPTDGGFRLGLLPSASGRLHLLCGCSCQRRTCQSGLGPPVVLSFDISQRPGCGSGPHDRGAPASPRSGQRWSKDSRW